jgi:tetratricopeptide (TPR) repeat protein
MFRLKDGDLDEAADYLERALNINQEIDNVERQIWGHLNVGQLIIVRDNDDVAALEHYRQALKMGEQTGFKLGLLVAHMRLGLHFQSTGEDEFARQHITTMRDIAVGCDYRVFVEQAKMMLSAS